jgi:tRNA-dihydrouridine synthase B
MLTIGTHKINNPYILAPMAGVSQMPFRRLAIKMGAGLAPTELISAKGLFFGNQRTKSYLRYDNKIEKPFMVQLFGGEEESMAMAAARALELGADIIDINMGCPVKKVTKTNAGSALLCDFRRAQRIVSAMIKATAFKIPITVKIRSGWDSESLNYLEVAKALEEAGASALAIHPRTRAQGYAGKANWQHIADLKTVLKIPVIGNGDVTSRADALKMQAETNCDGVMIGRAALGNPWIFRELCAQGFEASSAERLSVVLEHLHEHIELQRYINESEGRAFTEQSQFMALKSFRSHLIWYSKGMQGGSLFREKIMSANSFNESLDSIQDFFSQSKKSRVPNSLGDDGIDYRQAFG